jgi:acid phosphatase family membrane protein YuiD
MYLIILVALGAGLTAQTIKMFVHGNHIRFSPKNIVAYSGMPSGHSATVVALTTIIGLTQGTGSAIFAMSVVFAVLVIRDAIGIRKYLGEHGKILNALVKELNADDLLDKRYPHLLEKIGHTPAQVAVGGLIGFLLAVAGYLLFY